MNAAAWKVRSHERCLLAGMVRQRPRLLPGGHLSTVTGWRPVKPPVCLRQRPSPKARARTHAVVFTYNFTAQSQARFAIRSPVRLTFPVRHKARDAIVGPTY